MKYIFNISFIRGLGDICKYKKPTRRVDFFKIQIIGTEMLMHRFLKFCFGFKMPDENRTIAFSDKEVDSLYCFFQTNKWTN